MCNQILYIKGNLAGSHEGPNGPTMHELVKEFSDIKVIHRLGEINAWDYPEFVCVQSYKQTGGNQVEMRRQSFLVNTLSNMV